MLLSFTFKTEGQSKYCEKGYDKFQCLVSVERDFVFKSHLTSLTVGIVV